MYVQRFWLMAFLTINHTNIRNWGTKDIFWSGNCVTGLFQHPTPHRCSLSLSPAGKSNRDFNGFCRLMQVASMIRPRLKLVLKTLYDVKKLYKSPKKSSHASCLFYRKLIFGKLTFGKMETYLVFTICQTPSLLSPSLSPTLVSLA